MILHYITWNPDPEIINIFGFSLRYYGVFFAGGLIVCMSLLGWIFRQEDIPSENLDLLSTYGMIGILVGARLGHCLFYEPSYYLSHPLEMILPISITDERGIQFVGYQGLASHGGALGILIALYFYARKTKHAWLDILDLIAVVAPLACGFIRLGNLMNSEIIGIPTQLPWGVIFERVDQVPRHPAQLYEAMAYFTIFIILMNRYKVGRERFNSGFFFGLVLVLCFTARFIIEFVKENQVGFEETMMLNMGQLLSLPYLIVGFGLLVYGLRKKGASREGFEELIDA